MTYLSGNADREGSAALTLEELYEWDPDYVIFEFGSDLNKLANDPAWAELRAPKEGHCYNCPMCLDEWLMPGIENALLYEWGGYHFLGTPSEKEFKSSMKRFYQDYVACDMTDEDINAVASGDAAFIYKGFRFAYSRALDTTACRCAAFFFTLHLSDL